MVRFMRLRRFALSFVYLSAALIAVVSTEARQAPAIDTSKIGPQVGSVIPAFTGRDQNGATQSLKSVAGPKGTMLVFFRSADW